MKKESLIQAHGGYRKLKSFQVSQLVFDVTVRFCEKYVSTFSRTKDQMIQAARSGVQNIAEGPQSSATSKKTELKLTQVAFGLLRYAKAKMTVKILCPLCPPSPRCPPKITPNFRPTQLWFCCQLHAHCLTAK